MAEYSLTPVEVPQIETKYRSIKTAIPVPESLPFFERLRKRDPGSGIPSFLRASAQKRTPFHERPASRYLAFRPGLPGL